MKMKICNGRFEATWDGRCWSLVELSLTATGKTKRDTTYHQSLDLVCKRILQILAGNCKDLEEVIDLLTVRAEELVKEINK